MAKHKNRTREDITSGMFSSDMAKLVEVLLDIREQNDTIVTKLSLIESTLSEGGEESADAN